MSEEKIKTSRPGLHLAAGVPADRIEVIAPETEQAVVDEQTNTPADTDSAAQPNGAIAPEATPAEVAPATKAKINPDDLSDEEKDELIKKITGKTLKELTPVAQKTPEQLAAEAEKKRNDALAWNIEAGRIKRADYEKAIADSSKTDRDIALSIFIYREQASDKDLTKEEAEEMFKDTYHENDPESKLYKIGQEAIKKIATDYRKETAGFMDSIEPEYDNYLQTQDQYKSYKSQIKEAAAAIPSEITFENTFLIEGKEEKFTYTVSVDEKILGKLTAEYSKENQFALRHTLTNGKLDTNTLKESMLSDLKARLFDNAIPELLKQHGENVKKHTLAVIGNKAADKSQLNNGRQPMPKSAPTTAHDRPGLRMALNNQN